MACSCQETVSHPGTLVEAQNQRFFTVLDQYVGVWGNVTDTQNNPPSIKITYLTETKRIITADLKEGISGVFSGISNKLTVFTVFNVTAQTNDVIFGNCFFTFLPISNEGFTKILDSSGIQDQNKAQYILALKSLQDKIISSTSPAPCIVATLKSLPLMVKTIIEMSQFGFLLYETICKSGELGIVIVVFRFKNVAGELRDFSVAVPLRTFVEASKNISETYFHNGSQYNYSQITEVTGSSFVNGTCNLETLHCLLQCHGSGASAIQCLAKCVDDFINCINGR